MLRPVPLSSIGNVTALTYDANGNVQTRTLPGGTTTYGYDELNRLTSEAGPAKTQSLTYDANDNRTSDGTGTKTYTANTDRIVTENGQSFTLDVAGNITQARGLSFTWNQAVGQIRTVSQGATLLATYYYDYKGRRTRKVTTAAAPQGAGTVIYTYDLYDRLKGELDGAGHPLRTYVWREDTPVSIILQGPTETALYLEVDHLNTPIAARDQSGKLVWAWESDAFGSTLPNEDPDGDGTKVMINLRFPGQYSDRESGLHYNYRRYYDPKLGRYMSPDPIGLAGGNNLYGYVGGNPLKYSDPLGLLVDAVFNRATGTLVVVDRDNPSKVAVLHAFSGIDSSGRTRSDPIPVGTYDILELQGRNWFRLDRQDSNPCNDVDDARQSWLSSPGSYRLHPGSVSLGCITVSDRAAYAAMEAIIRATRTDTVQDMVPRFSTNQLPGLGHNPYPLRFGSPTNMPIQQFGTLTVLEAK